MDRDLTRQFIPKQQQPAIAVMLAAAFQEYTTMAVQDMADDHNQLVLQHRPGRAERVRNMGFTNEDVKNLPKFQCDYDDADLGISFWVEGRRPNALRMGNLLLQAFYGLYDTNRDVLGPEQRRDMLEAAFQWISPIGRFLLPLAFALTFKKDNNNNKKGCCNACVSERIVCAPCSSPAHADLPADDRRLAACGECSWQRKCW